MLDVSECKNRNYLNKNTYPGIIVPDRADASRMRLGGKRSGEAEFWIERHRAPLASLCSGDGAHTDIEQGCLEDGDKRGEGGRHRERSMHAGLDQAKYIF